MARLASAVLHLPVLIALHGPVRAVERPSFDCTTAATPREVAVCLVPRLARADRAMAVAYVSAKARLSPAARAALVQDQRRFLEGIDFGFQRSLFNKEEPTRVRQAVAKALEDDRAAFHGLQEYLDGRTAMLSAVAAPKGRFDGSWATADTTLALTAQPDGTYKARFDWEVYGYPRDHCGFDAVFRREGDTLVSDEQAGDDDYVMGEGWLVLAFDGDLLTLRNTAEDKRTCGRDIELKRSFFRARAVP